MFSDWVSGVEESSIVGIDGVGVSNTSILVTVDVGDCRFSGERWSLSFNYKAFCRSWNYF